MPGDMSASATTFSTVVREGPWMCSAEMHASISRCRCRTRDARSGATATVVLDLGSRPVTTLTVYRAQSPESTIKRDYEIKRTLRPLAHHPAAAVVPAGVLSHPVRVRPQDQLRGSRGARAALHRCPDPLARTPPAAFPEPVELSVPLHG